MVENRRCGVELQVGRKELKMVFGIKIPPKLGPDFLRPSGEL
jgi:hypothetical protein